MTRATTRRGKKGWGKVPHFTSHCGFCRISTGLKLYYNFLDFGSPVVPPVHGKLQGEIDA
jgi:hypothetical protein